MEIFDTVAATGHEQLLFCYEPTSGYRCIIAIHDTTLGPALGGTRFWNYANETDAIRDALRLSRGMSYKAAIAGLNLGGGKSVIIGDPRTPRREALFRAHGRFIETLAGRYITAEDVGTSVSDMDYVRMETEYVTGLSGASGDPSPVTAFGVYRGIKAATQARYGSDSLHGLTVTVQGLGHVGYYVCQYLATEGARLVVTDIDEELIARVVREFGAEPVARTAIYDVEANIYAPCALGATINDDTLTRLKVDIVAGAANNVLAEPRHGVALHERGVLYAPDYVINAGGLINVYGEIQGWTQDQAMRKAGEIHDTLARLFALSAEEGIPTSEAADRIAENRIREIGQLQLSR
ncbi:MAG: leucine dehydrogenase [Gemmatimonadota bacterium]|nr:leucine dehydrogenase [Gemmatimonadota bacterium]